ncbi:MAG: hypothetical protein QM758_16760 [Armatimonas sp.]
MRRIARFVFPMAATLLVAVAAQKVVFADYIFATLEDGKVRFALLDNANGKPNPQYESYVTGLAPLCAGKTLTLSTREGAAYTELPKGVVAKKGVVTAEKVVGIRERGGEKYLLVYHAKGAATLAAASAVTKVPAEVSARRSGEKLIIAVRQAGKLVPDSEVWVQWPGDETTNATGIKTNAKGEVEVAWPTGDALKSGFISIRAKVNEVKDGELEGQKYPLIRRWATLTFPVTAG